MGGFRCASVAPPAGCGRTMSQGSAPADQRRLAPRGHRPQAPPQVGPVPQVVPVPQAGPVPRAPPRAVHLATPRRVRTVVPVIRVGTHLPAVALDPAPGPISRASTDPTAAPGTAWQNVNPIRTGPLIPATVTTAVYSSQRSLGAGLAGPDCRIKPPNRNRSTVHTLCGNAKAGMPGLLVQLDWDSPGTPAAGVTPTWTGTPVRARCRRPPALAIGRQPTQCRCGKNRQRHLRN